MYPIRTESLWFWFWPYHMACGISLSKRAYFWPRGVFVAAWAFLLLQSKSSRALGLQQLRHTGSVLVGDGLSYSVAYGTFPDQGLNPCLLHLQADSSPLSNQGSPYHVLKSLKIASPVATPPT